VLQSSCRLSIWVSGCCVYRVILSNSVAFRLPAHVASWTPSQAPAADVFRNNGIAVDDDSATLDSFHLKEPSNNSSEHGANARTPHFG
jgi:hypothetical protein